MTPRGGFEYFTDGPKASAYARYLKELEKVITPVIVLYEVGVDLQTHTGAKEKAR